jgi:hypothetical protein
MPGRSDQPYLGRGSVSGDGKDSFRAEAKRNLIRAWLQKEATSISVAFSFLYHLKTCSRNQAI